MQVSSNHSFHATEMKFGQLLALAKRYKFVFFSIIMLFVMLGLLVIFIKSKEYSFTRVIQMGTIVAARAGQPLPQSILIFDGRSRTVNELAKVYIPEIYANFIQGNPNTKISLFSAIAVGGLEENVFSLKGKCGLLINGVIPRNLIQLKGIGDKSSQADFDRLCNKTLKLVQNQESKEVSRLKDSQIRMLKKQLMVLNNQLILQLMRNVLLDNADRAVLPPAGVPSLPTQPATKAAKNAVKPAARQSIVPIVLNAESMMTPYDFTVKPIVKPSVKVTAPVVMPIIISKSMAVPASSLKDSALIVTTELQRSIFNLQTQIELLRAVPDDVQLSKFVTEVRATPNLQRSLAIKLMVVFILMGLLVGYFVVFLIVAVKYNKSSVK